MIIILEKRIVLTLCIVLGCLQVFAQEKSDKEKEGLVGPVAKMKIESTYLERKNEKWVESERHLWGEWEYDRAGKLVNIKTNPVFGDPRMCEEKYKYDEKGRETAKFCMDGAKERVLEKYSYEEDSHGNWTKRVASSPDGETFHPQWILYRELTYFN
jgi:hypothetical protein